MEVSIIVPAYNEAKLIKESIGKLLRFSKENGFDHEIIVVDDGSRDDTKKIVSKIKDVKLISYHKNRGKGYAVRQGMLAASKENIVIIDADIPWEIELMKKLLDFQGHDISIGSRAVSTSKTRKRPTFARRILGMGFNRITSLITGLRLGDTQSGFKAFKRKAARRIFEKQTINGWAFDVEMLYLAKKYGYRVREVPIDKVEQLDFRISKVKPVSDSIKMFFSLIKIRLNDISGKY